MNWRGIWAVIDGEESEAVTVDSGVPPKEQCLSPYYSFAI